MALLESRTGSLTSLANAYNLPRFPQWGFSHFPQPSSNGEQGEAELRKRLESVDLTALGPGRLRSKDTDTSASPGLGHPRSQTEEATGLPTTVQRPDGLRTTVASTGTFHRWMKSLRRKASRRPALYVSTGDRSGAPEHTSGLHRQLSLRGTNRRQSTSESSFRFVSAVRSASVSLLSVSHAPRSSRTARRSHHQSNTDRSSKASLSAQRISEDSIVPQEHCSIGGPALRRALQRRRILEELIETEEGYIGDVRFLLNVYVTILASHRTLPHGLRSSIHQNLTEMVLLHEEILGELHSIVPHSEYTQMGRRSWEESGQADTQRDPCQFALFSTNSGSVLDELGMFSEPQTAAEVARVFVKRMHRFFIYQEYGAKYEMMIRDMASTNNSLPDWEFYQKGLETLASVFSPSKGEGVQSKKSMTIGDLLVKPIQRICKYPLLFSELLKHTPADDCPNSQMQIQAASMRFREVNAEINSATDDSLMKSTLEKTWLLQDRLVFPDCRIDATSRNRVRSYGHIQLCGVLHACWQGPRGVEGCYFACFLYQHVLCLASASRVEPVYTIQASIKLDAAKLEDVDTGQGRLQCHTAPHSWKLIFECGSQLYEIILTACSPTEEREWRCRLDRPSRDLGAKEDPGLLAFLYLDAKSLGTVFGKPGTVARKISIHRATTIGPKSPFCQVVLRNTSTAQNHEKKGSRKISRSQSLLTTNVKVPVLAPARNERARIEACVADVWSREVLPFPGILAKSKSEQLVRASASHVMRKLNVSTLASSMKRTGSITLRGPADTGKQSPSGAPGPGLSSVSEERARKKAEMDTLQKIPMKKPELDPLRESVSQCSDGVGSTESNAPCSPAQVPSEHPSASLKRSSTSRLRMPSLSALRLSESSLSLSAVMEGDDKESVPVGQTQFFPRNCSQSKAKNHSLFGFFRGGDAYRDMATKWS